MTIGAAEPGWALVTDGPIPLADLSTLNALATQSLVAVMVPPRCYEHTRSLLPRGVRCVTHPAELQAIEVQSCVVWRGTDVLSRHGSAFGTVLEVARLADALEADPRERSSGDNRASRVPALPSIRKRVTEEACIGV